MRAKEAEGPFPWRSPTATSESKVGKTMDSMIATDAFPNVSSHDVSDRETQGYLDDRAAQACLESAQQKASALDCIAFKLPKWNALAGRVLEHAVKVIESLFKRHDPMIFKIGITHDAIWRWSNPIYGYVTSRDKWSHMVLYYCSAEPFGPSMLEAALIQRYQSISSIKLSEI